jgi:hypothetical protein
MWVSVLALGSESGLALALALRSVLGLALFPEPS